MFILCNWLHSDSFQFILMNLSLWCLGLDTWRTNQGLVLLVAFALPDCHLFATFRPSTARASRVVDWAKQRSKRSKQFFPSKSHCKAEMWMERNLKVLEWHIAWFIFDLSCFLPSRRNRYLQTWQIDGPKTFLTCFVLPVPQTKQTCRSPANASSSKCWPYRRPLDLGRLSLAPGSCRFSNDSQMFWHDGEHGDSHHLTEASLGVDWRHRVL